MNQAYANNVYKNNQVMTAPKKKLLIMLYDGAIKNLTLAVIAMGNKDNEKISNHLIKAQDIVTELMFTLDFEAGGEIATNLYQLYDYMYIKLIRANVDKDLDSIIEVKNYMEELRDTWEQV